MPCLRLLLGAVRGRGSLVWGAWRSGLIPELPEPRDRGPDSVFPPVSAGIAELLQPNCPTARLQRVLVLSSFARFCLCLAYPPLLSPHFSKPSSQKWREGEREKREESMAGLSD